jgi:hypothetical protein
MIQGSNPVASYSGVPALFAHFVHDWALRVFKPAVGAQKKEMRRPAQMHYITVQTWLLELGHGNRPDAECPETA